MRLIICSFCYAGSQRDEEWHKVREEERLFIYLFILQRTIFFYCVQSDILFPEVQTDELLQNTNQE